MKTFRKALALLLAVICVAGLLPALALQASADFTVSDLFISEVCFNPSYEKDNAKVSGDNDFFEYVEIKNVGSSQVNLSGASLKYSKTGLSASSGWYTDSLVFESGNDKIMEPGEIWVIGIYNNLTGSLGLGYSSDSEMAAYWKAFNTLYSCSVPAARRVIAACAPSKGTTLLSGATNLPNSGDMGAIKISTSSKDLAAVEYSPNTYNTNGFALQFKLSGSTASIAGTAGCSPYKIYPYQTGSFNPQSAGEKVEVVSFNVTYKFAGTADPGTEDRYTVASRQKGAVDFLKDQKAGVLCLQEVNNEWFTYLNRELIRYDWVGVSNAGSENGEGDAVNDMYNPIFYRKSDFDEVESGNFWLTEGAHTHTTRVCTWIMLKSKDTGNLFVIFNTHLSADASDGSYNARASEVKKIGPSIDTVMSSLKSKYNPANGSYSYALCGDFNINEGSVLYNRILKSASLNDSKYVARSMSNLATFQNWGARTSQTGTIIDFCFVSKDTDVASYTVTTAKGSNGYYYSDHNPINITLVIQNNASEDDGVDTGFDFFAKVREIFRTIIDVLKTIFTTILEMINTPIEEPIEEPVNTPVEG